MRDRLAEARPPAGPYDVKHLPGGLLELGFIAEALQLIAGPTQPGVLRANTAASLAALAQAGVLPRAEATALITADRFWRTVQGMNRITGLSESGPPPPISLLRPLLAALQLEDEVPLRARMIETAAIVRDSFARHIGGV
jgi:glutamate-ammonia-ligase adenylyltransferase